MFRITAVTFVFTLTLWLRLFGATAAGWMADRVGRKTPLMISILRYSICNFIAGFAPTFWFLFLFRALLGIGMGAGMAGSAALAMESWPARSRGFMSGILQGSWGLGFALSALACGFLYEDIGWRGLLRIGILPALVVVWIRFFVKEPEVWAENKRLQAERKAEVYAPLFTIFKRQHIFNTLTGCLWMGAAFCVYYSIWALFSTYLQKELKLDPGHGGDTPVPWANIVVFAGPACGAPSRTSGAGGPPSSCPASSLSSSRRSICGPPILSGSCSASSCRGVFGGSIYGRNLEAISASASPRPRCTRRHRLRLSPGRDLGRPGGAGHQLLRGRAEDGLRHADDGEHHRLPARSSIIAVALGPETKGKILTADLETMKAAEAP